MTHAIDLIGALMLMGVSWMIIKGGKPKRDNWRTVQRERENRWRDQHRR